MSQERPTNQQRFIRTLKDLKKTLFTDPKQALAIVTGRREKNRSLTHQKSPEKKTNVQLYTRLLNLFEKPTEECSIGTKNRQHTAPIEQQDQILLLQLKNGQGVYIHRFRNIDDWTSENSNRISIGSFTPPTQNDLRPRITTVIMPDGSYSPRASGGGSLDEMNQTVTTLSQALKEGAYSFYEDALPTYAGANRLTWEKVYPDMNIEIRKAAPLFEITVEPKDKTDK